VQYQRLGLSHLGWALLDQEFAATPTSTHNIACKPLPYVFAPLGLLTHIGPLAVGYGNLLLFPVNGALALALTWAVSSLTFQVIEQPFLSMRRRYVGGNEG